MLADAEAAFAAQSPDELPGENFFYEHVHLTFEGNHLLARVIGEQVERLLAPRFSTNNSTNRVWPSAEECARRLGWTDWSRLTGWKGVLPRLRHPPFTGQFDSDLRMRRVEQTLKALSPTAQPQGISNALVVCETTLATTPEDLSLLALNASLRQAVADFAAASQIARRRLELLPSDAEGWQQLGLLLARQRRLEEAIAALERAIQLDPQDVSSREHRAQILAALGRQEDALAAFRQVLKMKPRLGLAWLHYGQALERAGQTAAAEESYRKALANSGSSLSSLLELAGFCQNRGWHDAAVTNYVGAIAWEPTNAKLHIGAGQNFAAMGRLSEAAHHSAEAVRLAPDFAEARLLHGLVLGRQGQIPAATEQFREALRLRPDLLDARLNLGIALADQNPAEALEHLERVLQLSPNHPGALNQVQRLRSRLSVPR